MGKAIQIIIALAVAVCAVVIITDLFGDINAALDAAIKHGGTQ